MRSPLLFTICLAVSLLTGVLLGAVLFQYSFSAEQRSIATLYRAITQINRHYVAPMDHAALTNKAIDGLLTQLDADSMLLDQLAYESYLAQSRGHYGGVGLRLQQRAKGIFVESVVPTSPAAKAKINSGDQLIEVDSLAVAGQSFNQLLERLRGPVGSKVTLATISPAATQAAHSTLTRAAIAIQSVSHRELEHAIGLLRIKEFSYGTAEHAAAALADLQKSEMAGLIIDLRNNPGGLLTEAIAVADLFVDQGQLLVTRGGGPENVSHPHQNHEFVAQSGDILAGKPIAVLVNGASASAAEVVATALQRNERATLIGTRTFGKGSVQTLLPPFDEQRRLKLTTAYYLDKNGERIHNRGILPDIVTDGHDARTLAAAVTLLTEAR